MLTTACRQASAPLADNDTPGPSSAQSDKTGSPAQPQHPGTPRLFDVLTGGPPLPNGLVPEGDCPPAGPSAAQEVAAQAEATVPLKPGLTLADAWMRSRNEEYECLTQIQSVDNDGVNITTSCDFPERPGTFLRRVCREDLRSARMVHTAFGTHKVIGASGEELPETIVGATAISMSSAAFAELKRTGSTPYHYVELGLNGQLEKDGVGELRVEGRGTAKIAINGENVDVPVIKTSGNVKWRIQNERSEVPTTVVVLDDERFPLLVDHHASNEHAASRIQFTTITYPSKRTGRGASGGGPLQFGNGGGGSNSALEGGLLEDKRVDVYGIYFDFNSDRIRKESEPVLQEIGDVMQRHPDWRLNIDGHTDSIGGDSAANLDLSRRRSEAVRKALIGRFGITADRLSSGGHGAASPKDTNDTPEGRARNRRVELSRR
jgi:outer membrane protein OmpA-like peptidoglycan-associated protein